MNRDRARIIAPPPLLGLLCIGAGFVARHYKPLPVFASRNLIEIILGGTLFAAGVAIILISRREFIAHGTHPNPYRPTAAVVQTGPYKISRNPIYVAFLLIVCAFVLLANSWWFLGSALVLWLLLQLGVVSREEEYLGRKFGEEYRRYCTKVRRWV